MILLFKFLLLLFALHRTFSYDVYMLANILKQRVMSACVYVLGLIQRDW